MIKAMKKKYTKPEMEEVVMQDLMDVGLRISGWISGAGDAKRNTTWQEEEEDSVSNHNPWSGWDVEPRPLWND